MAITGKSARPRDTAGNLRKWQEALLSMIDWIITASGAGYLLLRLANGFQLKLAALGFAFVLALWAVPRLLLRAGRYTAAAVFFTAFLWSWITLSGVMYGGLAYPGLKLLVLVVLAAAILLGWHGVAVYTLLSLAAGLGLYLAASAGLLPTPLASFTPADEIGAMAFTLLAGSALLLITLRNMTQAMETSRRDAEEREREELSRRESEENFRAIAENVRDGIIIAQPDGQVLYANRCAADILGGIPADLRELTLPHGPASLGSTPFEGQPNPVYEAALRDREGRVIYTEVSVGETTWLGGKASMLVLHDVTETRRKETEMIHRNYELELLAELSSAMREVDERSQMASMVLERSMNFFEMESGLLAFNRENLLQLAAASNFTGKPNGRGFYISDSPLWGRLLTGEPLVIEDTLVNQPYNLADLRGFLPTGSSFLLLIPLMAGAELNGLIMLLNRERKSFSSLELRLMVAIADMAGTALERMSVFETLEQRVAARTRELSALYHVTAVSNEYGEASIIFSQALQETLAALGCMTGGIFIQESDETLKLAARQGGTGEFFENLLKLPDPPWTDQVMKQNKPVLVPDIRQEPSFGRLSNLDNSSFIGVPVRLGSQVLGCMAVIGEEFERFTLEDVSLLISIGEQIGTAAVKVRLQNQSRQVAVDRERRRLARDLHDSVTQQIYSLTLFAGAAEKFINLGDCGSSLRYVKRIEEVAEQALKGMRLLIFELRPAVLKSVGLIHALRQRLESVEQRAGVGFELDAPESLQLPASTDEGLYHIATEALNNSLRHSQASRVKVSLKKAGNEIYLEISDNGQGMAAEIGMDNGGMGLRSMRERAEMMGGKFRLTSAPGEGTQVRVDLETNHG